MPANVQALFAGRVLPVLDGEEQRERKHFVLAAFSEEALESYVPQIRAQAKEMPARCAARAPGRHHPRSAAPHARDHPGAVDRARGRTAPSSDAGRIQVHNRRVILYAV
jgi:cytochrome P450